MHIKIETISPAVAEAWLNSNQQNRKLRQGVVEQYAADMKAGKWTECPEPISFYTDGDLADGQHRLWAIVESDTSQTFPVARGLSREAGLNINTGLNRSLVDNSKISGVGNGISNTLISTARAMAEGVNATGRLSNSQKMEYIDAYRDHCDWAIANGPVGKSIRNAISLGAVARAHQHGVDLDKLKRFCVVLGNGFMDGDHESAAVAIRNYMLAKDGLFASSSLWHDSFLKMQNAIAYFVAGRKLTIIKGVKEEAFPLKKLRRRKAA